MDTFRDPLIEAPAPRESLALATIIVIRYAVPLPDTTLAVARPYEVRVAALKRSIRTQLPDEYRERDLKLICAGRVLLDTSTVSIALRLQPPRSSPVSSTTTAPSDAATQAQAHQNAGRRDLKGKGKAIFEYRDEDNVHQPIIGVSIIRDQTSLANRLQQTQPTYVHCAVTGTSLSPQALAGELALSSAPLDLEHNPGAVDSAFLPSGSASSSSGGNPLPRSQPLLGFDRLLQGSSTGSDQDGSPATLLPTSSASQQGPTRGSLTASNSGDSNTLTRSDIANLRAQFRALVASRHTPDTMPDSSTLLQLEERWLDSSVGPTPPTAAAAAAGTARSTAAAAVPLDEEDTLSAVLDDMFLGVVTGFFWPIGALVWGLRETGVWSWRRQVSVIAGVLVNLSFGIIRLLA